MSFKQLSDDLFLEKLLGKGGMGEVYLAEIRKGEFRKTVAVKIAKKSERDYTQALIREAQIIAQLRHPNIAQVYDVRVIDDRPVVILEYIKGLSIKQLIELARQKGHFFSSRFCIAIFSQLLDALSYAHTLKPSVIHCDISPHNIMINEFGEVKILDFGISGLGNKKSSYGKIRYSRFSQTMSTSDDLHSALIVFYELLTLQFAFNGITAFDIENSVKHGDFTSSSAIRHDLEQEFTAKIDSFIASSIAGENVKALDLMQAFSSFEKANSNQISDEINELGIASDVEETHIELSSKCRRNKWPYLFGIATLVGLITIAVVFAIRQRPSLYVETTEGVLSFYTKKMSFLPAEQQDPDELSDVACQYLCLKTDIFVSAILGASSGKLKASQAAFKGYKDVFGRDTSFVANINQHCKKAIVCSDVSTVMEGIFQLFVSKPNIQMNELRNSLYEFFSDNKKVTLAISRIENGTHINPKLVADAEDGVKKFYDLARVTHQRTADGLKVWSIPTGNLSSMQSCKILGDILFANEYFSSYFNFTKRDIASRHDLYYSMDSKCRYIGSKDGRPVFDCKNGSSSSDSFYSSGTCLYQRENWKLVQLEHYLPRNMRQEKGW